MDVKIELRKTIKEYETKFNRKIPSWRCLEDERLRRLKEALETNTPYPEDEDGTYY